MPIGVDVSHAASLLMVGEVVGIPTETVYGLAGNALDIQAVTKIFHVKNRPFFDPLIVHLSSLEIAHNYAKAIAQPLKTLAEKFWPGPLTILAEKTSAIPDLVTAGSGYVALRSPAHPMTRELLNLLHFPLAAPSANPFGYISPVTAEHVDKQLGTVIPYILDGGPCEVGLESTIIGHADGCVTIYRQGGISQEILQANCNVPVKSIQSTDGGSLPGNISNHYAPRKRLVAGHFNQLISVTHQNYALLRYLPGPCPAGCIAMRVLSPGGSVEEAARNLFSALRDLDESPAESIYAELVPEIGLGRAINDRLRRAAAKPEN